jgi:hypothetical protein
MRALARRDGRLLVIELLMFEPLLIAATTAVGYTAPTFHKVGAFFCLRLATAFQPGVQVSA